MRDVLAVLLAYGLGSVVWGVVLGRLLCGRDPRELDNPGASGSVRLFGPALGIAVGVLDLAKGWLAVTIAGHLGASPIGLGLAATAAVAGHNWPIWFGFRGGGGLATGAGALGTLGLRGTLVGIGIALLAAAVYKHPRLYGRLPMAALPFGTVFGAPALLLTFWREGNTPGLLAAACCTALVGLRGLQMLGEKRERDARLRSSG